MATKFVDYVFSVLADATFAVCGACPIERRDLCEKDQLWCEKAIREALEASK